MSSNKTNKKHGEWDEHELDSELRLFMDDYTVEYPNDEAIAATIDVLRPYVVPPIKQRKPFFPLQLRQLHIRPAFWILNALFFVMGLLIWGLMEGDPYMIMMVVSPVPFLLGLLEIFRGRDEGLFELEMSCKYSAQQLVLMKLIAVGVYNVILCSVLLIIFSLFGEPLLLSKLIVYWAMPLTVTASIGLAIASRMRGKVTVPVSLVIWLFGAVVFGNEENFEGQIDMVSLILCGAITALAITFIIIQVNQLRRGQLDEVIH